ncbi:hypothetical protein BKA81DRAFT_403799 [Phyllosticta paracitricarpa]|uniref:Uncharacterized protein n=1 Tax=Phyllosticta citricarpa TaxID=55181 RepID=A0ABR1MJA3_9PEZI
MGLFVLEAIIAFIDTSCFCWGWMRTSEDLELVEQAHVCSKQISHTPPPKFSSSIDYHRARSLQRSLDDLALRAWLPQPPLPDILEEEEPENG